MTLGALSVCLTVLVLNLHHRDKERPVPAWAQTLVLNYLAILLCLTGDHLRRRKAETTERAVQAASTKVKVRIVQVLVLCIG